jgi:mRNA-degrading endonuclease HigB of HigAB toxin-antitoxin module
LFFIDDNHTDFKIVSILKRSGWVNTKSIKDVINQDEQKVKDADIIFVDISGNFVKALTFRIAMVSFFLNNKNKRLEQ